MRHTFFLALSIMSLFVQAQTDTLPIGKGFKTSSAKAYNEHFIQLWKMPDGTVRNPLIASKSLELLTLNNKPTWAFIQQYRKDKYVDSDTTFFDETTLQPLAYRTNIVSEGYKECVKFMTDSINILIQYKDSSTNKTYAAKRGYIQATMSEYLISKLPLKEGYTTTMRLVNAGKNYADMASTIRVIGKDEIAIDNENKVSCWKVEVVRGSKTVYWFSVVGQSLLKMEFGNPEKALFIKSKIYSL